MLVMIEHMILMDGSLGVEDVRHDVVKLKATHEDWLLHMHSRRRRRERSICIIFFNKIQFFSWLVLL